MRSYHDDIEQLEALGHHVVRRPQRVARSESWWRRIGRSHKEEEADDPAPWEAYEDIAWRCSACGKLITRSDLVSGKPGRCRAAR